MITTFSSAEFATSIAAVAAGHVICQIRPPQVALPGTNGLQKNFGLTRLTFELTTAVASQLGLTDPSTVGTATGPTTGHLVSSTQAGDGGVPITGQVVKAWTVEPTFPGTPYYYRKGQVANVIGNFIEWTWPEEDPFVVSGLQQNQSGGGFGIVVQNLGAGATGAFFMSARWKEFGSIG